MRSQHPLYYMTWWGQLMIAPLPNPFGINLAPDVFFLKPNFHTPYLHESEVSVRERKTLRFLDQQAPVTLLCILAAFRAWCHQLFPAPVLLFICFSSLPLSPSPSSPLLLLLCTHLFSGTWGHLFYFVLFQLTEVDRSSVFLLLGMRAADSWVGLENVDIDKGSGLPWTRANRGLTQDSESQSAPLTAFKKSGLGFHTRR